MKNFFKKPATILAIALLMAVGAPMAQAAFDGSVWTERSSTWLEPAFSSGRDILILGSNKYLNFGSFNGATGYGFRDNSGTLQIKNSGGSWSNVPTSAGTVTSVDMSVPTGLTIGGNPITTSGTLALTLTSGYIIPLSASTTNWNGFYDTPSTRITAGANCSWSVNTFNCTSAAASGAVATSSSETAGYVPFWTTTSATPALLSGDSGFQWDNTLKKLTATNLSFTLATGTSATTTNFAISSLVSTLLKTNANGSVVPAVAGTDYLTTATQNYKEAVKWATAAALPANTYSNGSSGVGATLTASSIGLLTVDGNLVSVGDRILVKNESTQANNGIYTVTSDTSLIAYVLTRATDFNQSADINQGDTVFTVSGSANSATTWATTNADAPTMGTTAITFAQVAGQGSFTAGNGISISGTTISQDFTFGGTYTGANIFNSITRSTTTQATTTSLFSTTASSTNLFSTNTNFGFETIGRSTTTEATTTSLYTSGTASSTSLRSNTATIGTLTVGSCTGCSGATTNIFSGTGADGALAISSGTTDIDVGGAAYYVKNYTSISITGTGALTFSNGNASGTVVMLKSQGACTVTSSTAPAISVVGLGGSGGVDDIVNGDGKAGSSTPSSTGTIFAGRGGLIGTQGSHAGTGGAGGVPYNTASSTAYGTGARFVPIIVGAGGGAGGGGDATGRNGGAGGAGGGSLIMNCGGALNITSTLSAAGGNGGIGGEGNTYMAGGGGGGGGGSIFVFYTTLTANSGTYTVSGGTGGNGKTGGSSTSAGGGGGGGGAVDGVAGTNGSTNGGNGGKGGNGISLVAQNNDF